MSNILHTTIIQADTVGLLQRGPVWLKGLEYVPASAGNGFTLSHYPVKTPIALTGKQITGTITGTNTLTSTGNLSSIYAAGALLHIIGSNGDIANYKNGGTFLITTAGNNNALVSADSNWVLTNEADKAYDLEAIPSRVAYQVLTPATEKQSVQRWFGDHQGIRFDTLALTAIDGGVLYLYL